MSVDQSELTSSELAVLETLHSAQESVSQRELARRTGFSVGLVNAVMKKLVHTGYVKTAHLNKRQLEYLLTPEGFAKTALRSYSYVIDTVRKYKAIRTNLKQILDRLHAEGVDELYLHGDGELADLVTFFCEEDGRGHLSRGLPARRWGRKCAILNASPKPLADKGWRVVDLVSELRNGKGSGIGDQG